MGKEDLVSGQYLSRPDRFSQVCNYGLFGGRPFIQPEKLRDLDTKEVMVLPREVRKVLGKNRDILKIFDDRMAIFLIGIENQEHIHYAMPLRQMQYDVIRYDQQWKRLRSRHEETQDLEGAEFLSGFSKDDRLIPVITLCVYWGKEPWDGPRTLHEMLDISEELSQYKDKIGDYPLNILEVCAIDDLNDFKGELKCLLGFIKYQKDKEALSEFMEENEEMFQRLPTETVAAMSVLGDSGELKRRLKALEDKKEENGEGEECVDVCQALREMIEDGRKEGRQEEAKRINQLIQKLLGDNRLEDLKRSALDREYQKKLFEEYGIAS